MSWPSRSLEPYVVVRVRGIPEQRVGNGSRLDAAGNHITGIERELGLKQRRAGQVGVAHQRVVRGEHDVLAGNRVAVRLDGERRVAELIGGGVLEDHAAAIVDRLRQRREILARVKPRLIAYADAGSADKRDLLDELDVEPEIAREVSFLPERCRGVGSGVADRRVHIAGHPVEVAVDLQVGDDRVNLRDGGEPRVPHGFGVVAAEAFHQARQPQVGHHRQVRARVPGIYLRQRLALEQRDTASFERQQVGCGQPGDAAADDHDVDRFITLELGKPRQRCRFDPVRDGVRVKLHALVDAKQLSRQ